MATTKKALVMADELLAELRIRLSALTSTLSYDTDLSPLIQCGAASAGSPGACIKVMPIEWPLVKTSLGLTQEVYTPHVIRVAFEANYAATNDNIADVNTWAHMLPIIGACLAKGAKVEVYVETNGTRPTASTFAAAKLVSTFDSLQYPMVSGQ